jgi:hypothetical protein
LQACRRTISPGMLVELQADLRPPQEPRERTLARLNRLAPHVPAVQLQQVEAPRKHVPVTVTPAQPLEDRQAAFITRHRLAVDDAAVARPIRAEGAQAFGGRALSLS